MSTLSPSPPPTSRSHAQQESKLDHFLFIVSAFLALVAVVSAVVLLNVTRSSSQWPTSPKGLKQLSPYPNMDKEYMHKIRLEKGSTSETFTSSAAPILMSMSLLKVL